MIKNTIGGSALLIFGVIVGIGVERFQADDLSAANGNAQIAVSKATVQQPIAGAPDLSQIRAMLREEFNATLAPALERALGSSQAGVPVQSIAPAISASSQERQEALQSATAILEGGRWGNEERISFHQQLARLDPADREQAMQTLVQAIDNGNLDVMTDGPPL